MAPASRRSPASPVSSASQRPPATPLPPLIVVTDGAAAASRGRSVRDVVAGAVAGGARCVLLRDKQLPRAERTDLACDLAATLDSVGGVLLVASDLGAVPEEPGAGAGHRGVHLAAADRYPFDTSVLIGRSCHGAGEVRAAAWEGCSYAMLSPIFVTESKPGYGPALGIEALGGHPLPVWALGGVTKHNARSCLDAGAAGVAVMGAVMRAQDPAAEVASLLKGIA